MVTKVFHGYEGKIETKTNGSYSTVALVSSVSLEVTGNITGARQLGSRAVVEWKEGNLEVSGTIEKMWYDHAFADEVVKDTPVEYSMKLSHTEQSGTVTYIELTGVVFTNWSRELPEDGITTESIDFAAKTFTTS